MKLQTRATIVAPVERVWDELSALDDYHRWNPHLRFDGDVRVGGRLRMALRLAGVPMSVSVRLVELDPESHTLAWRGGIPGVMRGLHRFRLSGGRGGDAGHTEVIQDEVFSGVLVPALVPVLRRSLVDLYRRLDEALRERCEADAG